VIAATAAAVVSLAACSSSGDSDKGGSSGSATTAGSGSATGGGSNSGQTINLVAYSVPKPAYDALGAEFNKTPEGAGVKFNPSYGPSGTQSKNVLGGQAKADFVNFSVGSDLTKLVPSKVAAGWDSTPTKGIAADSVVALVVKKGNPKHITGWSDLIKPGIKVVTPDPASSGSAKWNILAAYESVIDGGGNDAAAQAYLKSLFKNVVSRAQSGSDAMQQFTSGTGDVLISYEAEAIAARQAGKDVDYVVPDQNFLIETPAAVTTSANSASKAFLTYVESAAGQKIFASKGFRPALTGVSPGAVEGANNPSDPYPAIKQLKTIADLGGWSKVNDQFFGDSGIVTKIESSG
jgi:sulfate transport system substrate-binding protein